MLLTQLYLENYRVYEEPLQLELPAGLVGIYGPNGAGKSVLLESILFALWGRARTGLGEVRTAGVTTDCIAEVQFEHEGHLYVVRRSIKGAGKNPTTRAQAFADNQQVAEGVGDVRRYVHSILGMDDAPFRASVFAEQKQLAAFSDQQPATRKKLVLQLLGITPLDGARDLARKDAKEAQARFEKLRGLLPDLDELRDTADDLAGVADEREHSAGGAAAAAEVAEGAAADAAAAFETLDTTGREFERIKAEGTLARQEVTSLTERRAALETEGHELAEAATRLAELAPAFDRLPEVEARLPLVEGVAAATAAVAAAVVDDPPPPPDDAGLDAQRAEVEAAATALAGHDGHLQAAAARLTAARAAVERAGDLSGEADCPLCGQALGTAFEQVQSHRRDELAGAEAELAALEAARAALAATVDEARARLHATQTAVEQARAAWQQHQQAAQRRADAVAALAEAEAALSPPMVPGEMEALRAEKARLARDLAEHARLSGRLERRAALERELDTVTGQLGQAQGKLDTLLEKARALGFQPEALDAARTARDEARAAAAAAAKAAHEATVSATQARTRAEEAATKVAEAELQHAKLAEVGDDARHLARLADLLQAFRNGVVAKVGPMLQQEAGALFAELTDHEYEDFIVDPETYEIKLQDRGVQYGMDRFSGSETDLANLALRVAISEQVRLQSGGAVGLLVLDEVFGPLDEDRKARMLNALERLKGRFRQVLVVTHDPEIKEQLPNAIEVVKLPGRRATARVVGQ